MVNADARGNLHDVNDGRFVQRKRAAASASLDDAHTMATWTPRQIDHSLATALREAERAQALVDGATARAERLRSRVFPPLSSDERDQAEDAVQAALAAAEEAGQRVAEHDDEFERRGGWARAFLVTSSDGHVHSTRSCATCQPTTTFALLPHYSGASDSQVVADAGAKACTVCFPDAPVKVLEQPSRLVGDERRESQERRAAEHDARTEAKLAKGITTPGGAPLRIRASHESAAMRTLGSAVTAEREAVDMLMESLAASAPGRDPHWVRVREEHRAESLALIVPALAAKSATTPAAVLASLKVKAAGKYRRTYGHAPPAHLHVGIAVERAALGEESQ